MHWTIDTAAEHFWIGFGVGMFVTAWLMLVFFMWQRMPLTVRARAKRDLERRKARGRVRLAEARKLLDEYEKEFGVITEQEIQEMLKLHTEIIEEAP